jgi:hypothetical protein
MSSGGSSSVSPCLCGSNEMKLNQSDPNSLKGFCPIGTELTLIGNCFIHAPRFISVKIRRVMSFMLISVWLTVVCDVTETELVLISCQWLISTVPYLRFWIVPEMEGSGI